MKRPLTLSQLNPETRRKFLRDQKEQLGKLLEECNCNGRRALAGLRARDTAPTDLAEVSYYNFVEGIEARQIERCAELRRRVEGAKQRMADGTYGTCSSCGWEISLKRLAAVPITGLCLGCKSSRENARAITIPVIIVPIPHHRIHRLGY